MTVSYTLSNRLHVTGLPESAVSFYSSYCKFKTEAFSGEDVPPDLDLFELHSDGSISIPRGLESHLLSYLKSQNIPVTKTLDTGGESHSFSIEPKINYTSGPYGYQGPAVQQLLQYSTGRLEGPAGCGKTCMACLAAAFSQEGPLLFLVQTDRLFTQFVNTVPKVLGIPKEDVGILKGPKKIIKPITCGSLKTVGGSNFNLSKYKHAFSTVFFDECHLSTALTYRNVLLELAPKRLYGLSATPEHYASDNLNHLMEAMLGPVVVQIPVESIPGRITPEVFTRETGRSYEFPEIKGQPEWLVHKARHKLQDSIKDDMERNTLIVEDCARLINLGYKPLIAVNRIEHGHILQKMLAERGAVMSFPYKTSLRTKETGRGKNKKKVKVEALVPDHKTLNKEVELVADGYMHGIIGTYALFGTGFDCPALNAVLMVGPYSGRNSTLTIQVVGRAQRHFYGKESAVVFDYTDDCYPNNVLRKWSDDRAQVFLTEFGNRDILTVEQS